MKILKLGTATALAAMLATPAMAYISKDRITQQMTGYGHGNRLASYGPNGTLSFSAPRPVGSGTEATRNYVAANSGGTTWTWPVPLRRSGQMTAMNIGPQYGVPHAME